MNLWNSSFLCLDIGTYGVRGFAHRVNDAKITQSATHFVKNKNTLFALKSVIDELEQQLNTRFDSAFITGNFGESEFETFSNELVFNNEHKINELDIRHQIAKIKTSDDFYAMHIIPVYYSTPRIKNINNSPIGHVDTKLKSIFSVISYEKTRTQYISDLLRRSHIKSAGFFDSTFLQNSVFRSPNEKVFFIDLGNEFTTVSIWTPRGPLYFKKIKFGQQDITNAISLGLRINESDSDTLKTAIANAMPNEMDRFTPADSSDKFARFSRADINDIFIPKLKELTQIIYEKSQKYIEQYKPTKIILTGGGASIENINIYLERIFKMPVDNQSESGTINAMSEYIWNLSLPERNAYIERQIRIKSRLEKITKIFHKKPKVKKRKFIPVLPSTLCFNMNEPSTYSLFKSGGISMIHVDIMDGLYVDKIAGSISELSQIRNSTNMHLHVHLMTESPEIWARDAINAGADTIIVSTNTAGVKNAIAMIKKSGKRCGIAVNPESDIKILIPLLRELDEIMIMSVKPGAAGQKFEESVLSKIKTLNNTRKKHGLKYLISVDGGINPETAKLCWDAGADLLVSGSYLAKSPDFPLAVQSLLKH